MTGALAVILVLAGMIFFHELGHFLGAKVSGIGVETFSIGYGKALLSRRIGKTRWQIGFVPLGGYVDLVGMRRDVEIKPPFDTRDSYISRPPSMRLLTVIAGPLFNILLAWFIYWGLFWSGSAMLAPEVGSLMPGSPAESAGIKPGDLILSINGRGITAWDDVRYAVQSSGGHPLHIVVHRQEGTVSFPVVPTAIRAGEEGREQTVYFMGVVGSGSFIRMGFWRAGAQAFKEAWSKTLFIAEMVGRLFSQESSLRDNLGGPVMVAQTVHQQATHAGLTGVLKLTALLSINLGLLNLLPIPALDGGHVLFNSIELIFRRPIPERVQNLCTYLGFALLIGLMLLATAFDLFRLAG